MKRDITQGTLFRIDQEILEMEKNNPTLYFLLEKQIRNFQNATKTQVSAMINGIETIRRKFIQVDEKGALMYIEVEHAEGAYKGPLFKESVSDFKNARILSTHEQISNQFNKEVTEFFNITITVDL